MKVLLVEDSEVIRASLRELLNDIGGVQVVGHAENAASAIAGIDELEPDLVILDIRLKEGSGIEVLENLKKNRTHREVIVLTNYNYPQYRSKCESLGAHFFDKSTEFMRAIALIRKMAAESKA